MSNEIERARAWLEGSGGNPHEIITDLLAIIKRLHRTEDGEFVTHPDQPVFRLWVAPDPSAYKHGLPITEGRACWHNWWYDMNKDADGYTSMCRYFSTRAAAEEARKANG